MIQPIIHFFIILFLICLLIVLTIAMTVMGKDLFSEWLAELRELNQNDKPKN